MRLTDLSIGVLAFVSVATFQLNAAPAKKAQLEEGKKIYDTYCAVCHGATGIGDGAAAAGLKPKPRNFMDAAYMEKRPIDSLRIVISEGGQAVGLSPVMVGWKSSLNPAQIESVLQYVLSLSKGAKSPVTKKAK